MAPEITIGIGQKTQKIELSDQEMIKLTGTLLAREAVSKILEISSGLPVDEEKDQAMVKLGKALSELINKADNT